MGQQGGNGDGLAAVDEHHQIRFDPAHRLGKRNLIAVEQGLEKGVELAYHGADRRQGAGFVQQPQAFMLGIKAFGKPAPEYGDKLKAIVYRILFAVRQAEIIDPMPLLSQIPCQLQAGVKGAGHRQGHKHNRGRGHGGQRGDSAVNTASAKIDAIWLICSGETIKGGRKRTTLPRRPPSSRISPRRRHSRWMRRASSGQ